MSEWCSGGNGWHSLGFWISGDRFENRRGIVREFMSAQPLVSQKPESARERMKRFHKNHNGVVRDATGSSFKRMNWTHVAPTRNYLPGLWIAHAAAQGTNFR